MRDNSFHMQQRSFLTQTSSSATQSNQAKAVASSAARAAAPSSNPSKDDLARVFNTALLSTQAKEKRDFSSELFALTESASFKAILNAVHQVARVQGVSDRQAAEQVIQTFRKMDELWGEYVFREGLDKIRKPR